MIVFFLSSLIYCKIENSLSLSVECGSESSSWYRFSMGHSSNQFSTARFRIDAHATVAVANAAVALGVLIQLQSGSCHNNWRSHSTDIPHWMSFFWLILQVPAVARQLARVACALSLRILDGRWVTNEETLPLIYGGLEAKVRGARAVVSIARDARNKLKPQEQQLKIKIKSNPTRNKAMSMLNIFRCSACLKRPLYYSGKCLKHINQTQNQKNPSETQPTQAGPPRAPQSAPGLGCRRGFGSLFDSNIVNQ